MDATVLPNPTGRFNADATDRMTWLDQQDFNQHQDDAPYPTHIASDEAPAKPGRFRKNAWVWAASVALAGLTTFVLLDTFVIARVQQNVQAADFSSIVAAQESSSDVESATSQTQGDQGSGDSSGNAGGDGNALGAPASDGDDDNSASAGSTASSTSSDGEKTHSHGMSRGSGEHHGRHGGQSSSGTSDSAGKPSKKPGSQSGSGSGSHSSSSTTTDVSAVVAGAASAATAGTQVGSYSDENMQITVSQLRAYDTDIYVADVQVSSAEYLKTALAQNAFGRNLKDTTSNMAEEAGAILAINGDYYGFRDEGYVLRNGVLYRDTAASGSDALVVYGDGTMAAVSQDEMSADELKDAGAWQVLSFGPVLVDGGEISVAANEEVSQSKSSNPRTAIGMVDPLHYVIVVSDGRTGENEGLSLYELSQVLIDNGATFAYNLDGGGSTTLYFKGEVLNNPTSGNIGGEREVSDIVYFG